MSAKFILSFEHLTGRPRADQALKMLQRVASLVKPIMRKYGWNLPVLAEFFPEEHNLLGLNINMGQKIILRLRPHTSPGIIMDEEQVVQTMLHELTHNVHGPHDDAFYKFLNTLQEEYDTLKRSGYSGEGFFSPGRRVGEGVSHNVSPHQAHSLSLKAAEKRAQNNRILGGKSRLGGTGGTVNMSLRELAARAAERRARDDRLCGTNTDMKTSTQREIDKAKKDSILTQSSNLADDDYDYILIDDEEVYAIPSENKKLQPKVSSNITTTEAEADTRWQCLECTLLNEASWMKCRLCEAQKPAHFPDKSQNSSKNKDNLPKASTTKKLKAQILNVREWECPACTLHNPLTALECLVCLMRCPLNDVEGWTCFACQLTGNPHDFWACKRCGEIKSVS